MPKKVKFMMNKFKTDLIQAIYDAFMLSPQELPVSRKAKSKSWSHTKKGPGRSHRQGPNAKPSRGVNRLCTVDNPEGKHLSVRLI